MWTASLGPPLTCLWPSMKPGIALMPLASSTWPAGADGAPAATDTIFPPRTTIDPRSITVPLETMIRALVIVRSCADAGVSPPSSRQAAAVNVCRVIGVVLSGRCVAADYKSRGSMGQFVGSTGQWVVLFRSVPLFVDDPAEFMSPGPRIPRALKGR